MKILLMWLVWGLAGNAWIKAPDGLEPARESTEHEADSQTGRLSRGSDFEVYSLSNWPPPPPPP